MTKKRNFLLFSIVTILIVSILALSWIQYNQWKHSFSKRIHFSLPHASRTSGMAPKDFQYSAVIGGIGDILIHDWVYKDAKTEKGYNFKPMFQPVKSILQKPDFLIANQESIPGGETLVLSTYPSFKIADAIIDAGVDFVSTANNHALDKGEAGIKNSISYYDKKNLPYVGTFKNEQDQNTLRIQNVNGIKIAILAYTYGTNGIPVPKGKDYLVNIINKKRILEELSRARNKADLVILNLHWGIEYMRMPNEEQKELAKTFTDGGADVILGHHPHVLQPIEKLHTKDGRNAVVIYSLGNFISGQMRDYKDIGGMIDFKVSKKVTNNENKVKISDIHFTPTFVDNKNHHHYRVYPLKEAYKKGLIDHSYNEIMEHMTESMK